MAMIEQLWGLSTSIYIDHMKIVTCFYRDEDGESVGGCGK